MKRVLHLENDFIAFDIQDDCSSVVMDKKILFFSRELLTGLKQRCYLAPAQLIMLLRRQ